MKKVFLMLTAVVLSGLIFYGCTYNSGSFLNPLDNVENRVSKLTELSAEDVFGTGNVPAAGSTYKILVVTDVHFGSIRPGAPDIPLQKVYDYIDNNPDIKFCICLGDAIDYGSEEIMASYNDFVRTIEQEKHIKVINTVGNHDLYQSGWEIWKKNCYPNTSFYKFETDGFSFYGLDTGSGTLGVKQLTLFEEALQKDPKPKLIFTHYPLFTNKFCVGLDDPTERAYFYRLCQKNNVKMAITGHAHKKETTDFGEFNAYILPSLRFNGGFTVVEINESTGTATKKYLK